MTSKTIASLLGAAVLAAALPNLASSQTVFSEDFDSYTDGADLHGVNGWAGWDGASPATAFVSSDYAYSGSNSVSITASSDLVQTFSSINGGVWELSGMIYIPSAFSGESSFVLLNQYDGSGNRADYSWAPFMSFVGEDVATEQYGMDEAIAVFWNAGRDGGYAESLALGQWAEFHFVIDLDNNTVTASYNGTSFGTSYTWASADTATEIQAVDLWGNDTGPVYYDDIKLTRIQIPEPSTYALLAGAAALGVAIIRRRKRS